LEVSSVRSVLLNGSYQGIANLYYLVVRGVYVIVFARLVGVEVYGYYAYANNWYVMLTPVAAWGMQEVLISEYTRHGAAGQRALAGAGLSIRMLIGSAVALIVVLAACWLEPEPELRLLIIIYSQGILVRGIGNWFCGLFIARERSIYWLSIIIPCLTLEVALALLLAHQGQGLMAIAIAQCAVWWLTAVLAWLTYRAHFGPVRLRLDKQLATFYLRAGVTLAAASLILGCLGPGLLVVYRYLIPDLTKLGEIAFVLQLFAMLSLFVKVVSNTALPPLSRATMAGDSRLSWFAASVWQQSFYLGGTAFLACFWLLEPLVTWAVGNDFAGAARLFADYSWILIALFMMHGLRLVLITVRHQHLYLLAILLGLAALALQLIYHDLAGQLDNRRLMLSMGGANVVIAATLLKFVWGDHGSITVPELALPPLVLIAGIAVANSLTDSAPWLAATAGALPLLTAGALSLAQVKRAAIRSNAPAPPTSAP
jgi:O-antigen/teichoic acid export membrane protein